MSDARLAERVTDKHRKHYYKYVLSLYERYSEPVPGGYFGALHGSRYWQDG